MKRKAAREPDPLSRYRARRDFSATPEPTGQPRAPGRRLIVQRHLARRDHYDLRLEMDGVLKSWAVTRGPSADPRDRRLAVRTEDHPLDYADFEGLIPKGQYGGGTVVLWEYTTFTPLNGDPAEAVEKGEIKFLAHGERMRGRWVLVRMKTREKRENWLLIKERDEYAEQDDALTARFPNSIVSGRSREEIESDGAAAVWDSHARNAPDARGAGLRKRLPAPAFVAPSLCTSAERPPEGDDFLFEMKYDGYRVELAVGDGARLYTRSGLDWSAKFPGVLAAARALPCRAALVDGEAVAFDRKGLSDFPALVAALESRRARDVVFVAFDLLMLDGKDLRARPLEKRKEKLRALLADAPPALRFAEHVAGSGARVFAQAAASGAEGVVAKRANAPYRSGRTRDWLKIKACPREDVLAIGYMPSPDTKFRSLLAAVETPDGLRYAGRIGTGYGARTREMIWPRLKANATTRAPHVRNPALLPRDAVFLAPPLRAEVRFGGWTGDGLMRQARFLSLREDAPVQEAPTKATTMQCRTTMQRKTTGAAPVLVTHPERVIFPDDGVTKGDVAAYYEAVADRLLPHLANRPVSLVRTPDGIDAQTFFQRHPLKGMTRGVIAVKDGDRTYIALDGAEGLRTAAQFSAIELHGWMCRADRIDHPDRMVFDLDPDDDLTFADVRRAARDIADHLEAVGLAAWPMLSGGKGVHVVAPLDRSLPFTDVETFAAGFARGLARQKPDRYIATMSKAKRKGRIFIDWLRNKKSATAVLPWSLRARKGAPVATPVGWKELARIRSASAFDIRTAPRRGDPWESFFETRQTIPRAAIDLVRGQ